MVLSVNSVRAQAQQALDMRTEMLESATAFLHIVELPMFRYPNITHTGITYLIINIFACTYIDTH